ncbi:hypothetical protein CesoFtcFv8_004203 [Champsocephalus esox]|uniref:Uncharacterized protein n=2 Tax=Champsocephalus TaxID=52236 RepID=A0AAN8HXQ2_CHAGU|nr:hypothetical protein CesoFtcFv8_004203 [Champsocephalus esox]KAK5932944.1 hypothetical protein CgunFtcFv8_004613 [Champsocephalus gunnari]
MIAVIKEVVSVELVMVMVMEETNISPQSRAECHCEVLSSRLTGPVINDDRVWSCSSIRRQLYPGSPSR